VICDLFPSAYQPRAQISNETKGLYSGPSPIPKEFGVFFPKREKEKEI
jgi:hypothetical protein